MIQTLKVCQIKHNNTQFFECVMWDHAMASKIQDSMFMESTKDYKLCSF